MSENKLSAGASSFVITLVIDFAVASLIGLGGLGAILPNILDGLGTLLDFDNYISLRIFSIVYFILPFYLFTTIWFFIGEKVMAKYFNSGSNRPAKRPILHSSASLTFQKALIVLLQLTPIFYFINDQVGFIHAFNSVGSLGGRADGYGVSLFLMLMAFVVFIWKNYVNKPSNPKLHFFQIVLNSIDLIGSYTFTVLIMPWMLYSTTFYRISAGFFMLGAAVIFFSGLSSFKLYKNYKINQKGNSEVPSSEEENKYLSSWREIMYYLTYYVLIFGAIGFFPLLTNSPTDRGWEMIIYTVLGLFAVLYISYISEKASPTKTQKAFIAYAIICISSINFLAYHYHKFSSIPLSEISGKSIHQTLQQQGGNSRLYSLLYRASIR